MLRRGGSQRFLTTVLFTDIVGSTERAAELGDRGWKELVARHHAIVRRELRAFHGRELDTAGDGFFAIFDRPAQAIECATSIMDRLVPLGLTIRAAIHTGETEVMGDKVGGITVHVASRALALAAPGEILVTRTVREVAAGADVTFQDRGLHEFKGVPEEWDLYAVEWRRRELPTLDEPGAVTPTRRRTRWLAAFAVVIAGGVVIAVSTYALLPRGQAAAAPSPQPDSAMRIDPATHEVVAVIPAIDTPSGIAIDGGTVWVLSLGGKLLYAIPAAGGPPTPISLPGPPTGIAAGDGSVWVTFGLTAFGEAQGVVARVSAGTKKPEQTIPIGNGASGVAVGEGGVWVVNENADSLTRIDPITRTPAQPVKVGRQPVSVATGAGSVWVANAVDRSVWRIDPKTLVKTKEIPLRDPPTAIAFGLGRLWITSEIGNSVTVIDAGTNAPTRISLDQGPKGIAVAPGGVWVACGRKALVHIDPGSLTAASPPVVLPGPGEGVAISGEEVWVTVQR